MGKKYIIELPENTHWIQWIMEGTKDHHPYMDYKQVEDLTPYTEPDLEQVRKEAYEHGYTDGCKKHEVEIHAIAYTNGKQDGYQRGLNDAWEAARKIVLPGDVSGIYLADLEEIFDRSSLQDVIKDYSASEAIEKIRQYEQEQEEQIQVGDEVIIRDKTAVVTEITDRYVRIMYSDGSCYALFSKGIVKTGRHFPEIAEVLQKMKETDNG